MDEGQNERRKIPGNKSIINNALDVLDKLYNERPTREEVNLDFMQLNDIKPLIDSLLRFTKLKQLSLHGNRIKELSFQLYKLQFLEQLDISNNLIDNVTNNQNRMTSLKRLVASFKGIDEELIKQSLPYLQFYNNSRIIREKKVVQTKRTNKYQMSTEHQDKASKMFDQIRNIYRKSYAKNNDKNNKLEFDEDVKQTLLQMYSNLEQNKNAPDSTLSGIYLAGRYTLYKQLIQSHNMGSCYQSCLMTTLLLSHLLHVALSKTVANFQTTAKNSKQNQIQALEKELKRCRKQNEELLLQVSMLQNENKNYIQALVQTSKGQRISLMTTHRKTTTKQNTTPVKQLPKTDRNKSKTKTTSSNDFITASNNVRKLTLRQLKDLINQIQTNKIKYDKKMFQISAPKQSMYEYIFTYLQKKFGLKTLAIESASSIVAGIQKYSSTDNDIAVFGKILKNQIDQQFQYQQQQAKDTITKILKMQIKNRSKFKSQAQINQILQKQMNGYITADQAQQIISYVQNQDEAVEFMENLQNLFQNTKTERNQKTRRNIRQEEQDSNRNKIIKYSDLLNKILDKNLRKHQQYVKPVTKGFQIVDSDADGIINEKQFSLLLNEIYPQGANQIETFLQIIDPNKTDAITYSDVVKLFSYYPQGTPILSKYAQTHNPS